MMLVTGFWILDKPIQHRASGIQHLISMTMQKKCSWNGIIAGYERIFQGYGFKKGPGIRI